MALQKNDDLSMQSKAEQEQIKEAANKAALAEKHQHKLQEQFEALQQSLKKANADREKADQVCLPINDHSFHSKNCGNYAMLIATHV